RFVLFLEHATDAFTAVVVLLLLFSGAGSLRSRTWLVEPRCVWLPIFLIVSALLLYVFILPALLNALVGLPFAAKLIVCGVLLVPLGFAMGMPFPTGLRAFSSKPSLPGQAADENAVEWAWAMNAASSVLGSV